MSHPSETDLALYAGRDLNRFQDLVVRLHLRRCPGCTKRAASYSEVCGVLREQGEQVPALLHWERIASEMTANIRVGLQAGECVGPAPVTRDHFAWRTVALAACASALLVAAWTINLPLKRSDSAGHLGQMEIRTTAAGIELTGNHGGALTLMHSRGGAQKPVIVSTPGSLRSRIVDEETGQVTINNVYAE